MKAPRLTDSQKGFSILEAVVSSAILMMAILGANMLYIQQLQSESGMNLQIQTRQIMNQVISQILSKSARFPRVKSSSNGDVMTYVGCFQETGVMIGHAYDPPSKPDANFVGIFLGGSLNSPAKDPLTGGNVCPVGVGGLEVHVTWDPIVSNNILYIDAIILTNTGRQYSPAVRQFRTTVQL